MSNKDRLPKLVHALKDYSPARFTQDLVAGLTVGLVALPLAMAFAISSGVPPQSGLYCAVIAGFLVSALGGSRTQIAGPTGAFVVVVSGIVAKFGIEGLLVCTLMAGVILALMGLAGLGSVVKFLPRPVIVGFTNGIAVLIASMQIKDFLGLGVANVPSEFIEKMRVLGENMHTASVTPTLLALSSLAVIILCNRYVKRVPGSIAALFLGTVAVVAFGLPVETIGTKFGGIPTGLPSLAFPGIDTKTLGELLGPAFTIAMLGAIESLLSAVVADRMSGDRHNPNTELLAQGLANIASPLFGGLPATGAIARTATNIRSGATSPMAGIIHALTLLGILLFAAPLAQYIPLAVLAAILLVVAYNMGEWREIPKLLKMSKGSVAVWATTFALTVFTDLTLAVEVGIVLSALLYIQRVAGTTTISAVTNEDIEADKAHSLQERSLPNHVRVLRIHGPFMFGSTERLVDEIEDLLEEPIEDSPVVILRLRNMTAIDSTGLLTIDEIAERILDSGRALVLCGARPQPMRLMRNFGIERRIGTENICPNIGAALDRADSIIGSDGEEFIGVG